MRSACAIVGLGVTAQGIGLGIGSRELRTQAVELALNDAGLERSAIDGYIHTYIDREDLRYMGLAPNFSVSMMTGGATPVFSIISAVGAILSGQAEMVACVYGQAQSARESLGGQKIGAYSYGYPSLYGLIGAAATHALHARRHMHLYGTTSKHLGAVAVTQRRYAIGATERHRLRQADHARRSSGVADDCRSVSPARLHARHRRRLCGAHYDSAARTRDAR